MPRISFEEVTAQVVAQVTPGITHNELLSKLDAQYHPHLRRIVAAGDLVARAESVANGKPVVRYYLPEAVPSAPANEGGDA